MDLKDFIAIRGKSELFRIISKTPKGIIVETLNETKVKFKVQPNLQVLILYDITIFSNDNSDLYLKDIFIKMFERDGLQLSVGQKDEPLTLKTYFTEIVPNHDEEKVYISDIKRVIKWYNIVALWYPEVLENLKMEEEKAAEAEVAKEKSETITGNETEDVAEVPGSEEVKKEIPKPKPKPKAKKTDNML